MDGRIVRLVSRRVLVIGLVVVALFGLLYLVGRGAGGAGSSTQTVTTFAAGAPGNAAMIAKSSMGATATTAASREAAVGAPQPAQQALAYSADASARAGQLASSGGNAGSLDVALTAFDRRIVSTANVQIEVVKGKFQTAYDQALAIADRYDGYVVSSKSTAGDEKSGVRGGTITIRVPVGAFSLALRDAGSLGKVESRQIDSQDVTGEYVDLQARLKNAQSQEQALQDLMIRAKTVNEVLQVREVLSNTQQEIEQLKGQLEYLKEHTSYATLTLGLTEAGAPVPVASTEEWGFVQALDRALRGFVATVNTMLIGLGYLLPVLIILAIGGWIAYRVTRPRRVGPAGGEGRSI